MRKQNYTHRINAMKKLILLVFLTTFSFNAYCDDALKYYTIDEYFRMYPQQKELSEIFADRVSQKAEKMKMRQKKAIKLAVVYPAIQQSNYWRDSVTSIEKRLQDIGIRYEMLKYYSRPSGDYRLQAMQISEVAKSDVDYLIISVDNTNVRRLVPSLVSKKKPKVMIQNLTTPLKIWDNAQPFMYVGFDHIEGAKIIADEYSKLFPTGAKYLMLYGTRGTVSTQRGGGFESYGLSKGFVPVAKFYTDFKVESAYQATKTTLEKYGNIDFIYACSTDIAIGATKAVNEAGLTGKVIVNGWGGTLNELKLLKEKLLDFTVIRMNDDNGVAIAEAIKLDLSGQANKVPQIFSGEFSTATNEMTWDEINKLKERALRYSGK